MQIENWTICNTHPRWREYELLVMVDDTYNDCECFLYILFFSLDSVHRFFSQLSLLDVWINQFFCPLNQKFIIL